MLDAVSGLVTTGDNLTLTSVQYVMLVCIGPLMHLSSPSPVPVIPPIDQTPSEHIISWSSVSFSYCAYIGFIFFVFFTKYLSIPRYSVRKEMYLFNADHVFGNLEDAVLFPI